MTEAEQKAAAKDFTAEWKDKGYEKGESQPFWLSLLSQVFGIENPERFIRFEEKVHIDKNAGFIDGYIDATHVMIEQKGANKDLREPIRQSDGTRLTPFQQAKRYSAELPYSERPRWIVTCNFQEFLVYDMERPSGEPEQVLLKDLAKDYYRLQFLVDTGDQNIKKEMEVSKQAGELVGVLYDAFAKQYGDKPTEEELKCLNVLCVRLVFCLYAEDAGIFGRHGMFHDYLSSGDTHHMRKALIDLFQTLNTKPEDRDKFLEEELAQFPYVNGGLFANENVEVPPFTDEMRDILLNKASAGFDWSDISPTIFGAMFESTLNPVTRRSGGMHYTSLQNIHKLIDPLFLNDLKAELQEIEADKVSKTKKPQLEAFQNKLAGLVFLDPACGSGNFLTETYLSLRRLENKVIADLIILDTDKHGKQTAGQIRFGDNKANNPIKVSISQFYGIEINDFAVTVAKTALWIAESQTMQETEQVIHMSLNFLPLKTNASIHEGNALQLDWESIVPKTEVNYIIGNPPFSGARIMNLQQKSDMSYVFGKLKNLGNLDYVTAWYKKAADYIDSTKIRVAFVSTNSVTQGEQVAILWKPLMQNQNMHIDFAYRTFRWSSEASEKAHVHCVVIGFSQEKNITPKRIFLSDSVVHEAKNINGYLIDAPDIFIESKSEPLCRVPKIGMGNQPIDNGNYLFTTAEMTQFVEQEPKSKKYFKKWIGSKEFINQTYRYCLWLGNCAPDELKKMPKCLERVKAVKEFRSKSKRVSTIKIADYPTRFQTENMPSLTYIVIPEVSSQRRKYVPMGFMSPEVLCSNKVRLMPNATAYHFGVLESNVHMAWMRAVCGRLKSDYDYSIKIVYNNFPWPTPTEQQKVKIEQTAQKILDARALYPNSSLADLYDEATMPPELRKAHQNNDRAVMQVYGFDYHTMTEPDCVAALMKMYQQLTENRKN